MYKLATSNTIQIRDKSISSPLKREAEHAPAQSSELYNGNSNILAQDPNLGDKFYVKPRSRYEIKHADIITDLNPLTDSLVINLEAFGTDSIASFSAGDSKKVVEKTLAKKDFDFLYDQKNGGLYFNENGAEKGFGEGGIIAILKGAPDLTSGNLEFI